MISDALLKSVLARNLSKLYDAPVQITSLERSEHPRRSSFVLELLKVNLKHRNPLRLVFKSQGSRSLLQQGRRSRIAFPYDPMCELRTYGELLNPDLGTPTCYGFEASPTHNRYWLFLEEIAGTELCDIADLQLWELAARWLARFHNVFQDAQVVFHTVTRYDEPLYRLWLSRAERTVANCRLPSGICDTFERLKNGYDRILRLLEIIPRTVIHGEFYAPNVLVADQAGAGLRICPVDWGTTSVGPCLLDLAALTAGSWDSASTRKIINAYVVERDDPFFKSVDVVEQVSLCQIPLFIQWMAQLGPDTDCRDRLADWIRHARALCESAGLKV